MKKGYHIYFNNRSYWILDAFAEPIPLAAYPSVQLLENPDLQTIRQSIQQLDQADMECVVLLANEPEATWEIFKQQFKIIQAGGGLVKNERDEYLFIFRRGKWDLPKGKLDEGETIAECALREVNEETGLRQIELGGHLCNTYHTYHEKNKFILKESVWYHMQCPSGQTLTPQLEEDIIEVRWLEKKDWGGILENTFPSIKDVLLQAG